MDDYLLPEKIAYCDPTNIQCVADYILEVTKRINLEIIDQDLTRSWGGYLRFNRKHIIPFIEEFYMNRKTDLMEQRNGLDPKILIIAPRKMDSWRYHERRDELWRVIFGPVAVYASFNNTQPLRATTFDTGNYINNKVLERHRLVGLQNWEVVAEIWLHTDPKNPSDEDDIIRIDPDINDPNPSPEE